jgi:MFS transporter, BCD family, chlorophyll transporter
VPAFLLVMLAPALDLRLLFLAGNFLIGFGGALFAPRHADRDDEPGAKDQAGLALGAWGSVQATAAGVAMARAAPSAT